MGFTAFLGPLLNMVQATSTVPVPVPVGTAQSQQGTNWLMMAAIFGGVVLLGVVLMRRK